MERLLGDARSAGMRILACHQLTPELAQDVARASSVLFVDAEDPQARTSSDLHAPGTRVKVQPIPPIDRLFEAPGTWSHHLDPAGLSALPWRSTGRRRGRRW